MTSSFDDARCFSLHDGDRLIKLMTVTGQPSARLKYTIATTETLRAKIGAEQILEKCSGRQLVPRGQITATESFGSGTTGLARELLDRSESTVDPGLYGSSRSQ